MRLLVFCVIAIIASNLALRAEDMAVVRAADGFQLPVGPSGTGAGYYVARGYRPNGHLGEDWNGVGGGDTDLGDPVYAAAHGIVVFARNYHVGWGNVVIIRHAYYEGSELKYCDSLYGHLLDFSVQEGDQVHRGQQIGRIGNNFGMYEAHLHFEMRKNIQIGMYRSSFLRDFSNYYSPTDFVTSHHICPKGNHMVNVPINTFAPVPPPILAGPHVETPVVSVPPPGSPGRLAKIAPLPQTPGAPIPVFRTSKTYAAAAAPTPAPEPVAPKKEVAATAPATPTPAPLGKHAKAAAAAAAIAAASPTPPATSKRGKKIAAAATPEPKSEAAPVGSTTAEPIIKLADDSSADEPAHVVTSTEPPPGSKHSKKLTSASSPASSPQKVLQFQPVVETAPPTPKVATTDPTEAPAPTQHSTPSAKFAHTRKVAAATASPTPEPASHKPAGGQELTADSMALPTSDLSQARSSNEPTLDGPAKIASAAAKKSGGSVDLIPDQIAARTTPVPVRRTHRPTSTPGPGQGFAIVNGTQVVAPQPILPAPTSDVAPVRPAGSSYKIDRYQDLRGNLGY